MNHATALCLAQRTNRICSVLKIQETNPSTIQEDAGEDVLLLGAAIGETNKCTELLEVGTNRARITVDTDDCRRAHILHYTYGVTLWRL